MCYYILLWNCSIIKDEINYEELSLKIFFMLYYILYNSSSLLEVRYKILSVIWEICLSIQPIDWVNFLIILCSTDVTQQKSEKIVKIWFHNSKSWLFSSRSVWYISEMFVAPKCGNREICRWKFEFRKILYGKYRI